MVEKIKEIGEIEVNSTNKMLKIEEFLRSAIKLYGKEQVCLVSATVIMFFSETLKQLWRKHTELMVSSPDFCPEEELIRFLEEQKGKAEYLDGFSLKVKPTKSSPKSYAVTSQTLHIPSDPSIIEKSMENTVQTRKNAHTAEETTPLETKVHLIMIQKKPT